MGKVCTKCYKTTPKQLETQPLSPALAVRNIDQKNMNLIGINNNFQSKNVVINDNDLLKEGEKNEENSNWDNYFTKEQFDYYMKLYETESFDRPLPIVIKRIRKGELLGEGAFGKVFSAFDEDRGMPIAMKQIDIKRLKKKSDDIIQSVELEIKMLSNLNHKNIVKYFDVKRNEDEFNILLEYCIGGSISKLLATYRTLSENIIRKYTTQILEGLEYLHSHNIVHRDIKGANILVDRHGVCKLSDFGGAKMIKEEFDLKNSGFRGTPNWMSPESVKNSEFTRFSDIWSLGCTVIEMATGKPPGAEYKNPMSVLYYLANLNTMPPIPQNVSPELKDFLKCCLKIDPKQRRNVYELLRHPFITGDIMVDENNNFNCNNNKYENANENLNMNNFASGDVNMFSSKGSGFSGFTAKKEIELIENPHIQMQNEFLSKFNCRSSEIYNKNMNSEFAMKAHIYDSVRFNNNEISKSGGTISSQENEKSEDYISNSSPILLKFKEDGLFHQLRLDNKIINRISIHNTTPCYNNNPKDNIKKGKVCKNQNQKNNLTDFKNLTKH